jgi:hypothetical protein
VSTLALHEINGDSAGNFYLMDKESTGGTFILPEISSSQARNLPEKCFFPLGTTSSGTRNHWRNGYSAGNYQIMDDEST